MSNNPGYPLPAPSADDLPKSYEGAERERFWQAYWQAARIYEFNLQRPDGSQRTRDEIFSIDTPPPTVSGSLHIGHVYSYTQTDMTARYQRMRGKHVFYPFGFDDNGLPTERLVEREKGLKAHEYIKEHGREDFIALCREVVEKYEAQFVALWQSLALSCDWKQFYTTIGTIRDGEQEDKDLARAISQASFIDLYKKGIVYRKDAPTQWCWADQTAISQAEIEDREVPGHFHFIKFFWADGPGQPLRGELHIATTRPELIPACVAVMVAADEKGNPSNEQLRTWDGQPLTDYAGNAVRHCDLVGKIAVTPLFEVEVPILPSEKVQLDKGTGVLMCCTFGDMEDVEHWKQFNLPTRVIIGRDGRMGESLASLSEEGWHSREVTKAKALVEAMVGQKVKAAQAWIRDLLTHGGLMLEVRDLMHIVRHSERGGVPIEILVTPQWYVNILDHKQELIEQGRKINWQPEYMRKRYEQWVDGLNTDWCISRQRYNGIPFPVWYDEHRQPVLPAPEKLPVNPLADSPEGMTPDPDVMDTWATSSVTPLLNTHLQLGVGVQDGGTGEVPGGTGALARGKASTVPVSQEDFRTYRRDLPHWRLSGSTYFVTWRLQKDHSALPAEARDITAAAIRHLDGSQYRLLAFVVMDDHAHAVVEPLPGHALEEIVQAWKSVSAHRINNALGWTGPLWMPEYFDRIVRDEDELLEKCQYILNNPHKRWTEAVEYAWMYCALLPHATGEAGGACAPPASADPATGEGARATGHSPSTDAAQRHALLFPFDMRPQAHDIIRTWAFYTIAKAYFHFGLDENGKPFEDEAKLRAALPWKDIVISGHAQDAARQKMSKSKGNVVTPAELVEKYTADGIRYWSGSCKLGTDTVYDEKTLGEGRKLINKLFNATKFALRHLIGFDPRQHGSADTRLDSTSHPFAPLLHLVTYPTDAFLLARLDETIERATKAHDAFDFADAMQAVEDFFWADFCDNYLELSKGRLYGEPLAVEAHGELSPQELQFSAQATLYIALSSILRMFAPTLPHITEECWSWYFAQFSSQQSIHLEQWPNLFGGTYSSGMLETHGKQVDLLLATLLAVRKFKSEAGVSIKKPVARLNIYLTDFAPRGDGGAPAFTPEHLRAILGDLLSSTSSVSAELCAGAAPAGAVTTEKNPVAVVCEFAAD